MYTVVCFGDTNTWGYDNRSGDRLPYDERWTGMLAKELGADFRVIEEGLRAEPRPKTQWNRVKMPESRSGHALKAMRP